MKPDFKKFCENHPEQYFLLKEELANQFAEEYGKKCLEEAFNAGMFYQSQLPKDLNMNFNEWYNQKFKDDV